MIFASVGFLFYFLPLFLLCLAIIPGKNAVIVAFSLVFYAWGEVEYTYVLLASIVLNYAFGRAIDGAEGGRRTALVVAGLSANLSLLAYFKYGRFLVDILFGIFPFPADMPLPDIHLPLGISFFTFHSISYLVDVYRRVMPAERSLIGLAVYILLFPQLIAGPIVRYRLIAPEIHRRSMDLGTFSGGAQIFVLGLAQKVLIANTVAETADAIYGLPLDQLTLGLAWLGTACYTLQIYFDFAGYSTMAIGLALILGFHFPENFRHPYIAQSITDFWRRWHMTLSAWFRDYVYIPLGGNRRGAVLTCRNLLVVFLLCGLWHGAAWTFVAWGMWHGALLAAERFGFATILDRWPQPLRHVYALSGIVVGWVLFRSNGFTQAWATYGAMVGFGRGDGIEHNVGRYLTPELALALVIAVLASTPLPGFAGRWLSDIAHAPGAMSAGRVLAYDAAHVLAFVALLALAAMSLAAGTYNPFIYFRF